MPDPKMTKLDAELDARLEDLGEFLDGKYNPAWAAATPAAQMRHTLEAACERVSEKLCARIKAPFFSVEEHGAGAAMMARSWLVQHKTRHEVVLFTPVEK
jgi:hypothetical protein